MKFLAGDQLRAAEERLSTAIQEAADGSRTKVAEKRTRRAELIQILELLAGHVALIARGAASVVIEAGFKVRGYGPRNMSADIGQVQGLQAFMSNRPGEALLRFEPVAKARFYAAEWSTDGGQVWHNGTYASRRRIVVSGLPARSDVSFRVTAIGTAQRKGAPSAVAACFVL